MTVTVKRIFHFHEGNANMTSLLGGKGANLAEMTNIGLPTPPGFTITTDVCREYYKCNGRLPEGLIDEVTAALTELEKVKNQTFGNADNPLLVSVRSGSVTSMPGMMDTILNLGLNDQTVKGLARNAQDARFAYDCYRRLIQMFGNVVFGIESYSFEIKLHELKSKKKYENDSDIPAEDLLVLIEEFKQLIRYQVSREFPQDVHEQLRLAIEAVFQSWNNQRAKVYRKAYGIPSEQGTAVNIQSMVFGNLGEQSGTGVLFTRNPSNGEDELYGEFLTNAQGEDVVAGVRTPIPILYLKQKFPFIYDQLFETSYLLEKQYKDMQDIEFTIENQQLYILQTRNGKRTAQASVKIAVDLSKEGVITKEEALQRIEVNQLEQLFHRSIDDENELKVIGKGLPASSGAASGQVVFDPDTAQELSMDGKKVILVRIETTPEDIHGVLASQGVLTSRGGMTSHAAVVARGMGKPCVCGCSELELDQDENCFTVEGIAVQEGDWISIDGSTGRVILGQIKLKDPEISDELSTLLEWADDIRDLKVYANADNGKDAKKAREFGAEGIGLCRTEHMFMSPSRLPIVQSMIMAQSYEERKIHLDRLMPWQQSDFEELFSEMNGLPVTIRLLDPPLHEFLPKLEELLLQKQRIDLGVDKDVDRNELESLIVKVRNLHEMNPMLGQRGCRLGILYPEIYDMQIEAIFRAILSSLQKGLEVKPQLMIPLISDVNELKRLKALVDQVAEEILGEELKYCNYEVGTMIEVPRAALTANEIAQYAEFFSYGTNDLTQMTFGYSRDDAEGKFLDQYTEEKILDHNPFEVLDQKGVGRLIQWSAEQGKMVKPKLKTGVCGEHGGNKESIFFCQQIGLDYVSCSPFRIPLARIAAAQSAIELN
ncbi:pyruvate, phosphate dikinase [Chengkuizengella axinellae]|uniref:Pyruvate, phosphate dikinase n=1 Tax=Chengkuizengella axinellae TaxID=3064388 RepID=A0ABT9J449_9BACL|nr:pyruvate, phosphate dikinase [Chengkuizengella sp. 2205SS18-9]MDP5276381.1 pyruvate, phosphate dikinase [Chengkuizengella sp. 2205SS18-9]